MVGTRFAVAIHILLLLACPRRGGPATSHFLAESVNTNPVVVRRITGQLARAGLVRVRRGPGGAELTRPADQITLGHIWTAMHAERCGAVLSMHAAPSPECPVGRAIPGLLSDTFNAVELAMLGVLHETTLAGLMERLPAPAPAGMPEPADA